ncbi:MAG: hypothetical protein ABIO94_05805 [Opitutaceae bacterium]
MRFSCLVFFVCAVAVARGAAPLERDLGGGLIYYRAKNIPADIPKAAPAPKRSAVLDVRYSQAEAAGVAALDTWLKTRASAATPVFVLANAATSPALLALLARHNPKDGILVLGAASPGFAPDIAINFSPDAERRAYDAFELNPDTNALLKDNPAKVRNDEARLSRDHVGGAGAEGPVGNHSRPAPVSAPAPGPTGDSSPPEEKPSSPPTPPIDSVLQRALHLHRALLALKRI